MSSIALVFAACVLPFCVWAALWKPKRPPSRLSLVGAYASGFLMAVIWHLVFGGEGVPLLIGLGVWFGLLATARIISSIARRRAKRRSEAGN